MKKGGRNSVQSIEVKTQRKLVLKRLIAHVQEAFNQPADKSQRSLCGHFEPSLNQVTFCDFLVN